MDFASRCAVALGSLGVVALASACGAAAETDVTAIGKTNMAFSVGGTMIRLPPALDAVTGTPVDDGATCESTSISPPTSLADFGCSWGVEVDEDSNLATSSPRVTDPTGAYVQAYLWACLAVSPSGTSIQTTLATVEEIDSGIGRSTEFGGPAVTADVVVAATLEPSFADTCVGTADANYILVEEIFNPRTDAKKPGGCEGNNCGDSNGDNGTSGSGAGTTPSSGTPVLQF